MKTASIYGDRPGLTARLSQSAIFAYLSADELEHVVSMSGELRVKRGGTLFAEGDEGSELYIVDYGRIAITKAVEGNLEQVLAHMGPGDYFGEMALLEQIPRSATASAEEDSGLITISRDDLMGMMEREPKAAAKIMFNLLRTFTARLQATNDQLRETVRWGLEATGYRPEE